MEQKMKQEQKPEPKPEPKGDKTTLKLSLPYLSIHEYDGVRYQVTAVLKGGYIELTRKG